MDDLDAEVELIRSGTVSVKSRRIYRASSARFITWLIENNPNLVPRSFRNACGRELSTKELRKRVKCLIADKQNEPLYFERLTAKVFIKWILSMRKGDGVEMLSYSSYNSHRSTLMNLYRDFSKRVNDDLENELSNYFKGLKRRIAESAANGVEPVKVGKDPLSFAFYNFICQAMMKSNDKEMIFGRLFLIMCWNLMCRAANGFSICYDHMEWKSDSLRVYFAHMKNDQYGERPRDPRHIYANPINPEVCPILALGMYWLCYGFSDDKHLFSGNNQYDRYRKLLQKCLKMPEVAEELRRKGMKASDIGTHSIRKGSATFCSSGSTACPPATAIHLRAGWAMGTVQATYLRYEAAGDMYVGRTVCRLPQNSAYFAILPPFFQDNLTEVKHCIDICFPCCPDTLQFIAEFCLASLIYHLIH